MGASLVFGIQRVANFAHGEYLTFGAYAGLILNVYLPGRTSITATIVAMAATALLAARHPLPGAAAAAQPRAWWRCR